MFRRQVILKANFTHLTIVFVPPRRDDAKHFFLVAAVVPVAGDSLDDPLVWPQVAWGTEKSNVL